jgi:hypothetical protein
MTTQRRFFTRANTNNKPVCIIQGEMGFYPIALMDDLDSEASIDAKLAAANAIFNNTPKDISAAVGCSMFGWDTPLAQTIGK